MEHGMTTSMTLLLLLMAASLSTVAIASILVLCKIQLLWMKAFGEQHGVNLSTVARPEPEKTALREKPKYRIPVPIPGAEVIRQMRKSQ
jgi:hypothetical protein